MGWLRNYIRKNSNPLNKKFAYKAKFGLSTIYYFVAWNLFVITIIYAVRRHVPKEEEDEKYPSRYFARVIGTGEARVLRFSGLTKVGEYEIEAMKKPEPGRTAEEREAAELMKNRLNASGQEAELLSDGPVSKDSVETREDLNLLVEETNSL